MPKIITGPFEAERTRTLLAKNGDLKGFKETYSKKNALMIQDSNLHKFWDNLFSGNVNGVNKGSIFRDKKRTISRFFSKRKGRMLSVGFGAGEIEEEIAKSNNKIEIFGIDISRAAVENMSCLRVGSFIQGNILKIPFKSSYFDFVLALDVLEHIPSTKTFKGYRELRRVLKSKGILIVSVPINENLEEMVKEGKNPNFHLRVYTPEILKAELGTFGFSIIKEIYLYAFNKFYLLKSFLVKKFFFLKLRKPNLLIIIAKKV